MLSLTVRRTSPGRLALIILAISGVRLDRATSHRVTRLILFSAMAALYYLATPLLVTPPVAAGYAAAIWVMYYGGLCLTLGGPGRRALIRRLGEDRAYQVYEIALGLLFMNQGFAQAVVIHAFGDSLPGDVPLWASGVTGAALMAAGLFYKIWAAYTTGLDTYYCRDMFLGRAIGPTGELVSSGPYRLVRNPMYSVGNLQAYGWAVWSRSVEGLAIAALFQAGIYVFYHLYERPFVKRAYL